MQQREQSAVDWLFNQLSLNNLLLNQGTKVHKEMEHKILEQAKEMEKEQRGYTESDMRSYASYILNNPVIEPSQWYKIYRTKSE